MAIGPSIHSPPGSPLIVSSEKNSSPTNLRLSRVWLTISLVVVTLIPITLALTVWLAVPTTQEPALAAQVKLEPVSWPTGSATEARLMPGIRLSNPTPDRWNNISMAINDQYYFYCPDPLEPNSDFRVPLIFFRTSGDKSLRPNSVVIKKMTIYAQVGTGRRAILEMNNFGAEAE